MTPSDPSAEDPLRTVAAELYGVPPERFTAARTAAVRRARAAADRSLAAAIGAMRRPTTAAWAVNVLARRRPELVGQVLALGESLREAQSGLRGDALRDLTRQRRQLVAAVGREAGTVAAEEGRRLSEAVLRQVEDTVQAAMADPAAADAVRSGLLVQALSTTGLESLVDALGVPTEADPPFAGPAAAVAEPVGGRQGLAAVADDEQARREAQERAQGETEKRARREAEERAQEEAEERARREAEERAEEAEARLRKATRTRERAVKARAKRQARLLRLESELEDLRRRTADLEADAERVAADLDDRDAALARADRELEEARVEAEAASTGLRRP